MLGGARRCWRDRRAEERAQAQEPDPLVVREDQLCLGASIVPRLLLVLCLQRRLSGQTLAVHVAGFAVDFRGAAALQHARELDTAAVFGGNDVGHQKQAVGTSRLASRFGVFLFCEIKNRERVFRVRMKNLY